MNEQAAPSVWAKAMAELGDAGDRLVAIMADRGDQADAAEVYATILGTVMDVYLNQIAVDPEHPVFVPSTGYFQRLGTPNPDTVYRAAPIDDQGIYRLVGTRGTAADVTLMAFETRTMRSWPPFDLTAVTQESDGRFDVIFSAERPKGYTGHWWRLEPGTGALWQRSVTAKWLDETDPTIAITRLDGGARKRMTQDWMAQRLGALVPRVEMIVEYGIKHIGLLFDEGFINKLKLIDYGALGAMPLQSYQEGVFLIEEDQALLVEAQMPVDTKYFSWSLTDALFVNLDWTNSHASLNSAQGSIDADGVLRVVLSPRDPGTENWLQTTGYRKGVLQCRSVGSDLAPAITTRLLSFGDLADYLPANTPRVDADERLRRLRARQTSSQMRRLW